MWFFSLLDPIYTHPNQIPGYAPAQSPAMYIDRQQGQWDIKGRAVRDGSRHTIVLPGAVTALCR